MFVYKVVRYTGVADETLNIRDWLRCCCLRMGEGVFLSEYEPHRRERSREGSSAQLTGAAGKTASGMSMLMGAAYTGKELEYVIGKETVSPDGLGIQAYLRFPTLSYPVGRYAVLRCEVPVGVEVLYGRSSFLGSVDSVAVPRPMPIRVFRTREG
jgi:hypothetical protein